MKISSNKILKNQILEIDAMPKKGVVKHDPSQTNLRQMSNIDRDSIKKSQLQVVQEYKPADVQNHYKVNNTNGKYIAGNDSGDISTVETASAAPSKQFGQRSVKRKSDYNNTNPNTYAPNHKNDIKTKNDDVTDLVSSDGDEDNNDELDNVVQGNNSCNPLQIMVHGLGTYRPPLYDDEDAEDVIDDDEVDEEEVASISDNQFVQAKHNVNMKRSVQSQIFPYEDTLPDDSMGVGMGLYMPPSVINNVTNNYYYGNCTTVNNYADGNINIASGNNPNDTMHGSMYMSDNSNCDGDQDQRLYNDNQTNDDVLNRYKKNKCAQVTSNNNIQKEKYYYKSQRSHATTSEASEASEASEYEQNLMNEYILLQNELSKTRNRLDKAEIEGKEPLIETYSRYLCELQVKENIITQLAISRQEHA